MLIKNKNKNRLFIRSVFLFYFLWHTSNMNIIEEVERLILKGYLLFYFCLNKILAF